MREQNQNIVDLGESLGVVEQPHFLLFETHCDPMGNYKSSFPDGATRGNVEGMRGSAVGIPGGMA